jgi:exodeoxyribonuclease VII large subunit
MLTSSIRFKIQGERSRLQLAMGRMDALSPLAILERGYAICRTAQGLILKRASRVGRGDILDVTLSRGELKCKVEESRE